MVIIAAMIMVTLTTSMINVFNNCNFDYNHDNGDYGDNHNNGDYDKTEL